jgi:small redox-active disulfide protein 2
MNSTMIHVRVFGPGCGNCRRLDRSAREALASLEEAYTVEKVEDLDAMMEAGVFRTPALAIDHEIVFQGRVPTVSELKTIFATALQR